MFRLVAPLRVKEVNESEIVYAMCSLENAEANLMNY